jgi:hypothetical protein
VDIFFKILRNPAASHYDFGNIEGFVVGRGRGFEEDFKGLSEDQTKAKMITMCAGIAMMMGHRPEQVVPSTLLEMLGFKNAGFATPAAPASNGFSTIRNNGTKPKVTKPGRKAVKLDRLHFNTELDFRTIMGRNTKLEEQVRVLVTKSKIKKDLAKIAFGFDNIIVEAPANMTKNNLIGYHEINGMPFIGAYAYNAGEVPVFFILYFDGKEFRGYIPNAGNIYNTMTQSAFGRDTVSDLKWVQEAFTGTYEYAITFDVDMLRSNNVHFDWDILRNEIDTRIIVL